MLFHENNKRYSNALSLTTDDSFDIARSSDFSYLLEMRSGFFNGKECITERITHLRTRFRNTIGFLTVRQEDFRTGHNCLR